MAGRASASLEGRVTEVTGCATNDDACARAFVAALAAEAFRGPVLEAELVDLNAVYDAGRETDFEMAVRLVVEAVIASSSFNYRTELGKGAVTGAPVELTPHEIASLLSFWLTDSPPDARLASAADSGELSDAAELARHAERLLSTFAYAVDTSVAERGVFVRAGLLCLPRPPPKADILFSQAPVLRMPRLTERERAQFRAETVPCVNCHESIDPFGLLFENDDAIGRYREELEGELIDASVSLDGVGFPGTFQGVVDLVDTMAESPDFTACVARHLAVDATGAQDLATTDCEFSALGEVPPSEATLRQIIAGLASSALLRTRAGE